LLESTLLNGMALIMTDSPVVPVFIIVKLMLEVFKQVAK